MSEQNGKCGYIDDGYTIETVIPAGDTYPEVKITYRLVTTRIYLRTIMKIQELRETGSEGVDEAEDLANSVMATHIKEWSLKDRKGNAIEINPDNMENVDGFLSTILFRTVMGIGEEELKPEKAVKNLQPG